MFRSILMSFLLVTLVIAQCPDGSAGLGAVNGLCPSGYTFTNGRCCTTCCDKINPRTGTSDCPGMANYCQNSAYRTLMQDQCQKTCGFCNSLPTTTPTSGCADKINPSKGVSDCPNMASYCFNSAYRSFMQTECPKTCGFCR